MRDLRRRRLKRSRRGWENDKQAARTFAARQPEPIRAALVDMIDELIILGETPNPSPARVRELLDCLADLQPAVDEHVYRLAVVDAASEFLK